MNSPPFERWLSMWVIYDHPKDYPNVYIARQWRCDSNTIIPTENVIMSRDLEIIRHTMLVDMHLTCLPRQESDNSNIIETWM